MHPQIVKSLWQKSVILFGPVEIWTAAEKCRICCSFASIPVPQQIVYICTVKILGNKNILSDPPQIL
jgi:hypothetical protein